MSLLQFFYISLRGIFDFPWHRHLVDGTNSFSVIRPPLATSTAILHIPNINVFLVAFTEGANWQSSVLSDMLIWTFALSRGVIFQFSWFSSFVQLLPFALQSVDE